MEMGEFYNLSGCTILRSWDMLITSVVEPVTGAGTDPWLSRSHRSGVKWNWVDLYNLNGCTMFRWCNMLITSVDEPATGAEIRLQW